MNTAEKIFSVFAVFFAIGLITFLWLYPEGRELKLLLPLSLAGLTINIGLMFVVLRDIFYREFHTPMAKYVWVAIILFFWPAIVYYLPRHGFRKRPVKTN